MTFFKTLLISAIFCLASFQSQAQNYSLWFAEEFNGIALDTSVWTPVIGDGCPNLCGWGNNELEYYRAENATVANGNLSIEVKSESFGGRNYTSSRLITQNKIDFTYGVVEARIDMPEGQGIWPAFWMLSTNQPYGTWPASGEIDIVEMIGNQVQQAHGTAHYGNLWPDHQYQGSTHDIAVDFTAGFHTYAIEWKEDTIRWFVDSVQYFELTAGDLSPYTWRFDDDFYLLLNCAVGGNWPGSPDSTTVFPQEMLVDYVRVYKADTSTNITQARFDDIKMYPNPAINNIYFENLPSTPLSISIVDLNGKYISSQNLQSDTYDCSHLNEGLYLIEISDGSRAIDRQKLFINR